MPEKTSCLMSSMINDEKMDTATEEKKIPNLTKVSKIWCYRTFKFSGTIFNRMSKICKNFTNILGGTHVYGLWI